MTVFLTQGSETKRRHLPDNLRVVVFSATLRKGHQMIRLKAGTKGEKTLWIWEKTQLAATPEKTILSVTTGWCVAVCWPSLVFSLCYYFSAHYNAITARQGAENDAKRQDRTLMCNFSPWLRQVNAGSHIIIHLIRSTDGEARGFYQASLGQIIRGAFTYITLY